MSSKGLGFCGEDMLCYSGSAVKYRGPGEISALSALLGQLAKIKQEVAVVVRWEKAASLQISSRYPRASHRGSQQHCLYTEDCG